MNLKPILGPLALANAAFARAHPGDPSARQPVHTVYGGAHIFKADSAAKLGAAALGALQENAPTPQSFAEALLLDVPGGESPDDYARKLYARVVEKLKREPVEDFRIDFEDGYGNRPDAEEDGHAAAAAHEVARGQKGGTLPPFIGIRIKPLSSELAERSLRTLEIFVTTLLGETKRKLPANFVVTLPKVTIPEQVAALVRAFAALEKQQKLKAGALKLELMVETPQSIFAGAGVVALPALVAAAKGRCTGAHFGTYDYTAACNITAAHQSMTHPACDFAKHVMQVSLAATGVMLSDGATNIMPVGPHRAAQGRNLTQEQAAENRAVVHRAWRIHFDQARHSLEHGFYQGWDLHPAQLPTRYAAVYSFFLEGAAPASQRLKNFMQKAAQATLVGDVFDDAATGQGLLNYFLRGLSCGAISEAEALATGLSLEELKTRSFVKILEGRRKRG